MVMMLWVTGGGGGGDGGREGAAAAAEGGGDLERSPHHLHTSCLEWVRLCATSSPQREG